MFEKWISVDSNELAMVFLSTGATYIAILIYTRLVGLRSFSKMSATDFAMTVAVGSLFASTISSPSPSLFLGLFAIASLYLGQWTFAWLRCQSNWLSRAVDNEPLLLMAGSDFIEENLNKANVTKSDIYGKLRESNTLNYEQVLAVVFETTGDISVLHSSDQEANLEADFLSSVRGSDRLFPAKN
ncbi:DUF421 domain-containing protein [Planctomycetes bacterium K23_9]